MNASILAMAISSFLCVVTAGLLFSGNTTVPVTAEVSAVFAVCASLICFVSGIMRDRRAKIETEAARLALASERELSHTVESLLAGIRRNLTATGNASDGILVYPFVSRLLAAKTAEELASTVAELHDKNEKTERVLASLSDRIITDATILLPLADAIIKAVPAKTEEAAMTVMEKFLVVREASTNAAASGRTLREALDSQDAASVAHASDLSRNAVKKEREVIGALSAATKENRARLRQMSDEITAGLDLLNNIHEITEQSKLIAFNMSVEAARLGEKGNGFRVIIAELHKLNGRTFDFSKKVADLLMRFRDRTTELVEIMEKKSSEVVTEVERGMDAAETAVESLIEASKRTETFTREIAGMSDSIDHDLDRVLESLQFQDITRQMIEGALVILGNFRKSLDVCLAENGIRIDENRKRDRFDEMKKRFISAAKTIGEKEALMEVEV
jgi:methyl-accepting chemotaxis protein